MQTFIITKGWGGGRHTVHFRQLWGEKRVGGGGFKEESRDPPVPPCWVSQSPQRPHVPILGAPNSPNTPMSPY